MSQVSGDYAIRPNCTGVSYPVTECNPLFLVSPENLLSILSESSRQQCLLLSAGTSRSRNRVLDLFICIKRDCRLLIPRTELLLEVEKAELAWSQPSSNPCSGSCKVNHRSVVQRCGTSSGYCVSVVIDIGKFVTFLSKPESQCFNFPEGLQLPVSFSFCFALLIQLLKDLMFKVLRFFC